MNQIHNFEHASANSFALACTFGDFSSEAFCEAFKEIGIDLEALYQEIYESMEFYNTKAIFEVMVEIPACEEYPTSYNSSVYGVNKQLSGYNYRGWNCVFKFFDLTKWSKIYLQKIASKVSAPCYIRENYDTVYVLMDDKSCFYRGFERSEILRLIFMRFLENSSDTIDQNVLIQIKNN